jgi:hypothetical protein
MIDGGIGSIGGTARTFKHMEPDCGAIDASKPCRHGIIPMLRAVRLRYTESA